MHVSPRILATLTVALFTIGATVLSGGQTGPGSVRGAVVDASGGVLPGVTVVAAEASDGHVLEHDRRHRRRRSIRARRRCPQGSVHLTFELPGFSSAGLDVTIQPGVEARVISSGSSSRRAPKTSRCAACARGAGGDRAASGRPPPPPPPAPVLAAVPPHDHDSVCGPAKRNHGIDALGTVRAIRRGESHDLYAAGDELIIDGGTLDGLDVGRNLTVRRYFTLRGFVSGANAGEHTAGLLQIVSAEEHTSVGVVIYACDEIRPGDFLAAFNPEPIRAPEPASVPDFDQAARILFADADVLLGAPGRSMVIDRGNDYDWRAGQRVTLFRRENKRRPTIVGDAVVVAVRVDSSTIRILSIVDAVSPGDWAAPQRSSASTTSTTAASPDRPRR